MKDGSSMAARKAGDVVKTGARKIIENERNIGWRNQRRISGERQRRRKAERSAAGGRDSNIENTMKSIMKNDGGVMAGSGSGGSNHQRKQGNMSIGMAGVAWHEKKSTRP
jgi:hypothetical protein